MTEQVPLLYRHKSIGTKKPALYLAAGFFIRDIKSII